MFMHPGDVPTGAHYLVFDTLNDEWALWRQDEGDYTQLLVSWSGALVDTLMQDRWGMESGRDRYRAYIVRPENVDAIIMAAHHMTTEQWYRFAWRQSERQAL